MAFTTYTAIARENGITVPRLKKALAAAGYLEGKVPTKKAFDEQMVEMRKLDPAYRKYESDSAEFPVWNAAWVQALLNREGLDQNKGKGVWSIYRGVEMMNLAGGLFGGLIPRPRSSDLEFSIAWCQYESLDVIMTYREDPTSNAIVTLLFARLGPLFEACRTHSEQADPAFKEAKATLSAFLRWIDEDFPEVLEPGYAPPS